jgi:hypothetical protein
MASITESNKNFNAHPKTEIGPMEKARRNKRAGKFLLGAMVAGGVIHITAPNLVKAHEANKYGPTVVEKVPYTVGSEPGEAFVSEIASDMHQVAPHQDQTEADAAIQTYLPKPDQKDYSVYPNEHFVFSVDKNSGKILPKQNSGSSAETK